MSNAESSQSKNFTRLKMAFADLLLLLGLGIACWGVFKFSIAAGLIVSGIIVVILARAITPEPKTK
jgi:hypothetical protein